MNKTSKKAPNKKLPGGLIKYRRKHKTNNTSSTTNTTIELIIITEILIPIEVRQYNKLNMQKYGIYKITNLNNIYYNFVFCLKSSVISGTSVSYGTRIMV